MATFTFVLTMAQILQTAFIVLLIVEIFRLFGSFGKSSDGAAAKDAAVAGWNFINDKFDKRREKKQADAEKKEKEIEEENKRLEELGKYLATLAMHERDSLKQVREGIGVLKNLQENKERLNEPQVIAHIKSPILENMGSAIGLIRDNIIKRMNAVTTFKRNNHAGQKLKEISKDFDYILENIDTEIKLLVNKANDKKLTISDKTYVDNLKKVINILQSFRTKFIEERNKLNEYIGTLETVRKEEEEMFEKILQITRRIRPIINNYHTYVKRLFKVVNDLESPKDPLKKGQAFGEFDKIVTSMDNESFNNLEQGLNDLINFTGNIDVQFNKTSQATDVIKRKINELNNELETIITENKAVFNAR